MIARRLSFGLLLGIALPLALLGCGGDDHDEGHASDSVLSQSFDSATGLTVRYPDDWLVQEGEQGVYLANNDLVMNTVLAADGSEMPENGAALTLLPPLMADGYPGLVELEPRALVEEIAATLPGAMGGEVAIGEIEDAQVGEYPAARVSVARADQLIEGYLIGFKPEAGLAFLALVQAREGVLDDFNATLMQILQSVTYQPPGAAASRTGTPPSVIAPPTTTPEGAS